MKSSILIVTIGRTDIQVVVPYQYKESEKGHYPIPIDKRNFRELNSQIKNRGIIFSQTNDQQGWFWMETDRSQNQAQHMAERLRHFSVVNDRSAGGKSALLQKQFIQYDREQHCFQFEARKPRDRNEQCQCQKNERKKGDTSPKSLDHSITLDEYTLHRVIPLGLQPVELIAAKLYPLVYQFKQRKTPISNILVLNTDRRERLGNKHTNEEPFAFGEVIAKWLAEVLSNNVAGYPLTFSDQFDHLEGEDLKGKAFSVDYLKGEMSGTDEHYPVARDAIQVVNQALLKLRNAHQKAGGNQNSPENIDPLSDIEVIYSPGGGLPVFKPQIEAACRFFFPNVKHWVNQDDREEFSLKDHTSDTESYPSPDQSYQARKQILQLIDEGDFEGAAVIAAPFSPGSDSAGAHANTVSDKEINKKNCKVFEADQKWAKAVVTTAKWFQGTESLDKLNETLKEISGLDDNILPFESDKDMPNSLWTAFKVEAALRQKNYQDAIRYSCDLKDVAFLDLIGKLFYRSDYDKPHLSPDEIEFEVFQQAKDSFFEYLRTNSLSAETIKEKSKNKLVTLGKPVPFNTLPKWNLSEHGQKLSAINKQFYNNRVLLTDLVCYTDTKNITFIDHAFNKFGDRIRLKHSIPSDDSGKKLASAQDYRNIITHGFLPQSKLSDAKAIFIKAELWAESPDKEMRFLKQEAFTRLYDRIASQTIVAPAALYQALTNTLKNILIRSPAGYISLDHQQGN